ncbi:RNA polymerase recycling motor HelD [Radiobacillus sp. PE A8.2]|uniref:RNA polymerase recycling motor HelD n=1 Tax=Radiobacillus sp. PE A8.2 TaxID=3380349 RepID=UPI00388E61CF
MDRNDKEWIDEQKRVDNVVQEIENKMKQLKSRAGELKDKVIDIRKNFWEDVTVNLDEPDDIIETQASLKQQAEFLSERERSHGQLSEQLKTLQKLKQSPYFGRIDFREDGDKQADAIYIGIASMMDEQEEDFLIYDWRAPISNLYYDYPPGKAAYRTIDGMIEGEMDLKRQYIIRNSILKGMFDTGLTIGDHLLQSVLGNSADTNMKSIVATIQREQNQIIRNEKSKLLIVQGVAGSGKTSAALQRVAYLLYRYREILSSDNIMLFSPNPLFNSYVATVLPELGEENMKQTTFYEYVDAHLGQQFKVESPFEQMEYYLAKTTDQHYETRVAAIQYKASIEYKNVLDDFVDALGMKGLQFKNITFRGERIISKDEIKKYFYSLSRSLSIPNRLEQVADWLLTKVKQFERRERSKDWVLEETELLDKEDYLHIHRKLQEEEKFSSDSFNEHVREEWLLRKKVIGERLKPLKYKLKKLFFVDVKSTYIKLFKENYTAMLANHPLPEDWKTIFSDTAHYLNEKFLPWEDATPYLYFQKKLIGFHANTNIQHVFIDEAQDYSPFQFAYFKKIFPSSRMTLLGDINQAIYAHALHEETLLSEKVNEAHEKITLTRSYRSTKPIVEFTKSFMPNGDTIEAFNRDGDKPVLMEVESIDMLHEKMVMEIARLQEKGYQTVAIICKTMRESERLYLWLRNKMDEVMLMDQDTFTFQKGLIIIPAYLAKGIEFDAVIIHNASAEQYSGDLERNLFYTAGTRAMHELIMLSFGTPSPFIMEVPKAYYNHYKIHAVQKSNK